MSPKVRLSSSNGARCFPISLLSSFVVGSHARTSAMISAVRNYMESNNGFMTGMKALKWSVQCVAPLWSANVERFLKSGILPELPPIQLLSWLLSAFHSHLPSSGPIFHKRVPSYRHLIVKLSREARLVLDFGYATLLAWCLPVALAGFHTIAKPSRR